MANDVKYLEYKGRAFVRENDTICYGNMDDPYILYLLIMSYKKFGDTEIPDKIMIQVLSTDQSKPFSERIVKQGEKKGLYDALDVGVIWLERALA
ncbi:MAG: hypothetical protein IJU41_06585 [Clostridia bacterium]|nr:hypothetical protein [Clostridia bacterium]